MGGERERERERERWLACAVARGRLNWLTWSYQVNRGGARNFIWGGQVVALIYLSKQPPTYTYTHAFLLYTYFFYLISYIYTHTPTKKKRKKA